MSRDMNYKRDWTIPICFILITIMIIIGVLAPKSYYKTDVGLLSVHKYDCRFGLLTTKRMFTGDPLDYILNGDGKLIKCVRVVDQ